MNLGMLLPRHARYRPDHLALVFEDTRLTYHQLNQRVNRLANTLQALGIAKGDKVATILPNCVELLDVYWACAKIGAVVVPLSPLLRADGLATLLRDSDTVAVVADAAFVPILDTILPTLPALAADHVLIVGENVGGYPSYAALVDAARAAEPTPVAISDSDPYNIIYSSGTTGLPKGIVLTHGARATYCLAFAAIFRMRPESVMLHAGSLVFNGAFVTLMPALGLGATFVLVRQFQPESFIQAIERERATHMMMVPSQIIALLNSPAFDAEALRSLEMLCTVGAPLHKEHREALNRRLPGVFYELYGITEGFTTILDKYDYAHKPLSVGSPPPFYDIRIVDEVGDEVPAGTVGEIVGRSPMMMTGYYKRPDLTAQVLRDGWLHSGDLGYLDEDGYLYLVDRKKDMITSGGINVYPKDIEEVAAQHPAVREVAVFGVPDDRWGEAPVAAVVLREPGSVSADALRAWINERVAARYQQVREVILMDDFPRNVAGKTLKRVMRDPFWQKQGTKI